jgi:hypothetical protein
MAGIKESTCCISETWKDLLRKPHVRKSWAIIATNVKGFFEIKSLLPNSGELFL